MSAPPPSAADDPWPVEIRVDRANKRLEVDFASGETFAYPAEYLRVESPSAEVQGHGPDQKRVIAGRRHVGIMELQPIGHYAVQIRFDDLHDTGFYSWPYLYRLGKERDRIWAEYLKALEAQGLSRDP